MKVFLTGASGFLGSHIAELILKKNIELHVLVNKTPLPKFLSKKNIKIINSDLLKVNNFKKKFFKFDFIIHTAASVESDHKSYNTNVVGTRKLAISAVEMKVKNFIFVSTRGTFGISKPTHLSDENSKNFENLSHSDYYIKSKQKSENDLKKIFKNKDIKYYCIHPTALIGSKDYKPTPIGKFVDTVVKGKLNYFIDGYINIIDVRSAADLFLQILQNKVTPGNYGLGQHNIKLSNLVQLLSRRKKSNFNNPKKLPDLFVQCVKFILYLIPFMSKINPYFSYKKILRLQKGYSCFNSKKVSLECNFKKINLNQLIDNILDEK